MHNENLLFFFYSERYWMAVWDLLLEYVTFSMVM